MKRATFWLSTACLTFALGVVFAFLCFSYNNSINQKVETLLLRTEQNKTLTEMPILAFCELANNPEIYNGKIVRISAKFRNYQDGFKLRDLNCYGEKKEAAVVFNRNFKQIMEKIGQELGNREFDYWEKVEIIAVGRFRTATPDCESGSIVDKAHLQFEIMNVEKASPLP